MSNARFIHCFAIRFDGIALPLSRQIVRSWGRIVRPKVLEEIARVTRGQVLAIDTLKEFQQMLRQLPEPPSAVRRVPLGSHPVVAGSSIVLLDVIGSPAKPTV